MYMCACMYNGAVGRTKACIFLSHGIIFTFSFLFIRDKTVSIFGTYGFFRCKIVLYYSSMDGFDIERCDRWWSE